MRLPVHDYTQPPLQPPAAPAGPVQAAPPASHPGGLAVPEDLDSALRYTPLTSVVPASGGNPRALLLVPLLTCVS
jgi:hypothetical protein